jgi:carbon-monoxide dehydrogenase small subunit
MKRLLDVLREDCGHTGTKEGCGEGECGACTVLMDGMAVNSCLVPVVQADGAKLLTVEGLAHGHALSALQRAFVDLGGAQCGICTPGMLISAHELITRASGRVPGEQEVRDALAGNLCRCTGYQKIVNAVRAAARGAAPASGAKRGKPAPKRLAGHSKLKRKDAPGPKRRPNEKRAPGKKATGGKSSAWRAGDAKTMTLKRGTSRAAPTRSARKAARRRVATRRSG